MSEPFDIRQFPGLPPEVVKAFEAQQFELAVGAEKDVFITELKSLVEKLESQVADNRRTEFGPKSEKLSPDQLELALEDQETAIAETQQQIDEVQNKLDQLDKTAKDKKPRIPRKPRTLPPSVQLRQPQSESIIGPKLDQSTCVCHISIVRNPILPTGSHIWFVSQAYLHIWQTRRSLGTWAKSLTDHLKIGDYLHVATNSAGKLAAWALQARSHTAPK